MNNLEGVQVGDEVVHFRDGRKGTVIAVLLTGTYEVEE